MANWKVKIRGIRELLTDDNSDENAILAGKKVYKILTSKRYEKYFENFVELDNFNYVEGLSHFNELLNDMYDYCDRKRIWIAF